MNYSSHDNKSWILKFIIVISCLFGIVEILLPMITNDNVSQLESHSSQFTLEDLYGIWTIDFEQSVVENDGNFEFEFRSAYKYGHEMIFCENGDFSYYIGVGIGGEGVYTLENNKISVKITTYEEGEVKGEDFQIIQREGKKYIVKYESGFLIYWLKNNKNIERVSGEV